jgi:hypothetical protein
MSGQALSAKGIHLVYNGTVLAETTEVTRPKLTRAKDTGTGHSSSYAVHLPGEAEYGDASYTAFAIDDTAQQTLETLAAAGTIGLWKIVYPSTWKYPFKTRAFSAWISGLEEVLPRTGRATYKLTITPVEDVPAAITTLGAGLTTPFLAFTNQASEAITAITPTLAATTYRYAVTAFTDDTGIKITPTATTGTIYVNGTIVASGAASGTITLNSGAGAVTTIFVLVEEASTKTVRIYQIDVTIGTVSSPP